MNIYIANLGFQTKDLALKTLFEPYGEVTSARVITDKFSGDSRGFAFVEMKNDLEGQNAIQQLDNTEVEGRAISVSIAKTREERSNKSPFSNDNYKRN